jgi:hypothetical protein
MTKYAFLSDEWVGEAKRIYAEAGAGEIGGADLAPVRVNLIVTEVPFSESPVDAHVDTSGGRFDIDVGHVGQPDVTVSLGYDTARSLFVQGDVQSVLQAFLGGRIKVDGDLSKLLDPRSGIWPGGPSVAPPARPGVAAQGLAGEGARAPGQPGQGATGGGGPGPTNQGGAAGGPVGQPGFSFGGPEAVKVATRLQEITE